MTYKRLKPATRKDEIIVVALKLATEGHYQQVSRADIATAALCSGPTVQYHFSTMQQLRTEIMRAAVKREHLRVIAQGIVANDPIAMRAPEELRLLALRSLSFPVQEN